MSPGEKPHLRISFLIGKTSGAGNGSVKADYNVIGVRPSSGAASTGCSHGSDSIGARSRSDIAAPEDGRTPPSLTHYRIASVASLGFCLRRETELPPAGLAAGSPLD